jgi:protein-L-isoaspartate(D-aspartate) O-methyltransferase
MSEDYEQLVDKLVFSGYIKSSEIERAFRDFDRSEFLSEEKISFAGEDKPVSIGFGQTMSQPLTVAFMLDVLGIRKGDKVLDVGTGSGWQAALLSSCVGEEGEVITVERITELHDKAKENLEKFGLISSGRVKAVFGSALEMDPGWPVFDKIISAAESENIPDQWKNAIAIGGKIVAPVKGRLIIANKISGTEFELKEYPGYSFVPLIS